MSELFGICLLSHIPLRSTISHSSEMVSQLMFGETFRIEDKYTHWLKIVADFDGYTGWVDSKQIHILSKEEYYLYSQTNGDSYTIKERCIIERDEDSSLITLDMGSRLIKCNNSTFKIASNSFRISDSYLGNSEIIALSPEDKSKRILTSAKKWLSTPYLWGGKTISGTDCSGFVQTLFKMYGIALPRDAKDQVKIGTTIDFVEELKEGDLVFFDNESEEIVHVGIYAGSNKIIHSNGCVRIDSLDHQGIYNHERAIYSHHLRISKRVIAG